MRDKPIRLQFPAGGLSARLAYEYQSPYTTPAALNIRPDDASQERERGGTRPGLELPFLNAGTPITFGNPVNHIADVLYSSGTKIVACSNGTLYYGNMTTSATMTANVSTAFPMTSADINSRLYLPNAQSVSGKINVFNPTTNTVTNLVESDGTAPTFCTMVCRWNNRLVAAGTTSDPYNVYFAKQGDPTNWNYAPTPVNSQMAFALNASDQGRLGEPVTAIIPHHEGCLIIGCTNSIWSMQGDPANGGQLKEVTSAVGIHGMCAWCYDPDGFLYMLTQDGIYVMAPGCGSTPQSISRERLPKELLDIDRTVYAVCMKYDLKLRGIHLSVTPISAGTSKHYFIDSKLASQNDRGGAAVSFWPFAFGHANSEPICMHVPANTVPSSSTASPVYFGNKGGYISRYNTTATQDRRTNSTYDNITSYIDYGPFPLAATGREGLLQEVQVTLGVDSGTTICSTRTGNSAEQAYNATAIHYETLYSGGLNPTFHPRISGASCIIRFESTNGSRIITEDAIVERIDNGERRFL